MKNEIVDLAKKFIKIPYVSGSEDIGKAVQLIELAKEQLPGYTFTPFVSKSIPSVLFSNKKIVGKHFRIILNAHLDVITARDKEFSPYEDNGKLYGRGAKDMKAAAAAMILLFKNIGKTIPYPLGLQIVMDEETGGDRGTKHQLDQGIRTDFVISGEGTNLAIINESKRRLILKLIAQGKSSHSAYPWLGDNAIWKLQKTIYAILEKFPLPTEESKDTTVNITHIGTKETIYNKTPRHCEAVLDIRYTNDNNNILELIESLLSEGVSSEIIDHWPKHFTNPTNPDVTLLQQEAAKLFGRTLPLARAHGASDMPFYTQVGCDGIEFGPSGANHHGDNEWVDIQSLEDYYQILKQFLLRVGKEFVAETQSTEREDAFVPLAKPSLLYKMDHD